MGRKPIPMLLKATSSEGETRTFTSIGEAAKELGFSERGVGKVYHEKRNRIGEYQLEWLEPEPEVEHKSEVEKIKEAKTLNCWICGMPLERGDRVNDYLVLEKLDPVNEVLIDRLYPKSLYEVSKMADRSLGAFRHAAEKGNRLIARRRDKQPLNPINPGLLALELTLEGGVFHPPSITPLSLKLDCSNFAQSYFQIG